MINFDAPGFPYALLAVLIGLRLASFVMQRYFAAQPEAPAAGPALAPDDTADLDEALPPLTTPVFETAGELHHPLPAAHVAPDEPAPEKPKREDEAPGGGYRLFNELMEAGIIAVVLVFFLIRPLLVQAFYIPSGSMRPTLIEKDKVIATKFTYHLREPRTGDVVVFHAPRIALEMRGDVVNPDQPTDYVKRVIATGGQRVRVVPGEGVFVDGKQLNEPYIADVPHYSFPMNAYGVIELDTGTTEQRAQVRDAMAPHIEGRDLVVPPGFLFVLGDNRNGSHDSHKWGLLSRDFVVGKAVFIFWPLDRMGPIR